MDAPREPCSTAIASLCKLTSARSNEPKPVPSTASIPTTSHDRLSQAASENLGDDVDQPASSTVLYLAYGSNLCAETFQGVRGIKPLSQVNVSVPTLRLTFDLPGIPYVEPCFANVDWRKIPKNPNVPPIPKLPPHPPIEGPKPNPIDPHPPHTSSQWAGELMGVVYEVTQEDYRHIIQTEGGGSSYKEIIVPCVPIPPAFEVPEKPPFPELPRPFIARTLFAPYLPSSELPDDPRKKHWWYKFITPPHRPSPDYAQASARYLKLIRDGAREHELPMEYQRYLHHLQPYTITTCRQRLGRLLFAGLLMPLIMFIFKAGGMFADKDGKLPTWLMIFSSVLFNLSWRLYDFVLKPLFGDGERTEEKHKGGHRQAPCDEEKAALLHDEHAL